VNEFEKKIVLFFNKNRLKQVDIFSALISSVPLLIAAWIAVVGFALYADLNTGVFVCLGLAIVFVLHFIISEGVFKLGSKYFSLEKMRPYVAYPSEIEPIGRKFQDSSFPSSHITAMVGGLTMVVHFYPAVWPVAILLTAILSWSRLRNGMHYPADVLAGIALGLLYGFLALEILKIF
jgi:undecaprenyl-diphosphatase